MSTYTASRSASTSAHSHLAFPVSPVSSPTPEDEPDDEWKTGKKHEIEHGLQDMIKEAKARLESNILALTAEKGSREFMEQKQACFQAFLEEKDSLKELAQEEFEHALGAERVMRRLTRGGQINATVQGSMMEEQAAILAQIERDNTRRRDSTTGPSSNNSPPPDPSSDRPASVSQRSPEPREATQPPMVSKSLLGNNASSHETPPPSSPETSKPPGWPYNSGPSQTTAPAPHPPAPPTSSTDARFGSIGRSTMSPGQEKWNPPQAVSPGPPPADPHPSAHVSGSYQRAPSLPASSTAPASARFGLPRQASIVPNRTSPGVGPHGATYFDPPSSSGSSHRPRTSQTWNEATSTFNQPETQRAGASPSPLSAKGSQSNFQAPIQGEKHRAGVAPLNAKRSQSNFQAPNQAENHGAGVAPLRTKPSQNGFRSATARQAETWTGAPLTNEPEEEPVSERAMPMLSARRRESVVEKLLGKCAPGSPPASRPPPVVWTPSITPEQDPDASKFLGRERSGSSLRSSSSGLRKPIPTALTEQPTGGAPPPSDVEKNLEREAAQRQESERLWEGMDKSREKGKDRFDDQGQARGGARQSTASEQLPRQNDYVSGGSTSQSEGLSTSSRPPDSTAPRTSPAPAHPAASRPAGSPESIPNSSPLRSTYPSAPFVPSGISAAHPPVRVLPSFEDESDDGEEEDDYPSYTPEPPPHVSMSATGDSRSEYSPHTSAVPIPIPRRTQSPESPPAAYSAGEFSRYGVAPSQPSESYVESPKGPASMAGNSYGSYSSRGEDVAAAERERELQKAVLEAERIAKKVEEEAQRKVEEAKRKEEAAQQKEAAAQQKEAELRRQEAETAKKLKEITQREADLRRREEDMQRREEETKQKEAARQREEAEKQRKERERQKRERQRAETDMQDEKLREFQHNQQREAEARRRAEERKQRQGSVDQESNWSSHSSWNTPPRAAPGSPSSNTTSSAARSGSTAGSSTSGTTWSSSSKSSSASSASQASSNARPSTTAIPNDKPTWSSSSTSVPPTSPPYSSSAGSQAGARPSPSSTSKPAPKASTTSQASPPPTNPEDWARRQREQAEAQFRKMQEQLERERQAKEQKAGRMLSKEDVVRIYQLHEQQWSKMSAHSEVTWDMLPWPMYKKPNSAEEITSGAVDAYIMSPHYPDQDKSTKDRVRQQLRRWHEDHFNQKVLSKVSERDKERVKAGAGTVTRNLNNLLERANESKKSASSVFA
ncbi:hypothetical protein DFH07DRAFT_960562 [Mycena maculata]|uniref:Uncharacterized protein n=1 Tax=Mycena maculata TaxID=230809 RepID=A0AAD7IXD4_9AGAR|nr:hypothetical protein DFH07DRAFT_960562 [Mycena maculata]